MALSANTVWEIRTAGVDDQGGGFVTGASGTDYSQTNAKRTATGTDDSTTDAVANGTTTITSATAAFGTSIVGNIITLSGGTGGLTRGWYQVVTRVSATNITVDRTVAAGTGITMNIGGALLSPGQMGAVVVTGNYVWIKAGTYTITSASTNVAAGCVNLTSAACYIEGYNATRGDLGTRPLIQANGVIVTFTFISHGTNGQQYIRNIKFDGNNRATSQGCSIRGHIYDCEFVNFTNSAVSGGSLVTPIAWNCSATTCSTVQGAFFGINCINCIAYDNTISGFNASAQDCFYVRCVSDSNSGASSDGFLGSASSEKQLYINCVAYNNGRHGFFFGGQRGNQAINCIAETNAGTGYIHNANIQITLYNCAYYNNGTNVTLGTNIGNINIGAILGTGSFFTNAAGGDFSLNNTASAGASVRGAGTPGTILNNTTIGYVDIGAYQHQDAAGAGGVTSAAYLG